MRLAFFCRIAIVFSVRRCENKRKGVEGAAGSKVARMDV